MVLTIRNFLKKLIWNHARETKKWHFFGGAIFLLQWYIRIFHWSQYTCNLVVHFSKKEINLHGYFSRKHTRRLLASHTHTHTHIQIVSVLTGGWWTEGSLRCLCYWCSTAWKCIKSINQSPNHKGIFHLIVKEKILNDWLLCKTEHDW